MKENHRAGRARLLLGDTIITAAMGRPINWMQVMSERLLKAGRNNRAGMKCRKYGVLLLFLSLILPAGLGCEGHLGAKKAGIEPEVAEVPLYVSAEWPFTEEKIAGRISELQAELERLSEAQARCDELRAGARAGGERPGPAGGGCSAELEAALADAVDLYSSILERYEGIRLLQERLARAMSPSEREAALAELARALASDFEAAEQEGLDAVNRRLSAAGLRDAETWDAGGAVVRSYEAGDFEGAVRVYEERFAGPENIAPEDLAPVEADAAYALALSRLGRDEEAGARIEALCGPGAGTPPWAEPAVLEGRLADLYLYSGRYDEARAAYERAAARSEAGAAVHARAVEWLDLLGLPDGEPEGAGLLGRYVKARRLIEERSEEGWALDEARSLCTSIHHDSPASLVAMAAERLMNSVEGMEAARIRQTLDEAGGLVMAGRLEAAYEMVSSLLDRYLGGACSPLVDEALAQAEILESELADEMIEREVEAKERYELGVGLLEEGRFDEAIEVLAPLRETFLGPEAEERIAETAEGIVQEAREKAAELYLEARYAEDPAQKLGLLEDARRILLAVLERFPTAQASEKARRNLSVIEGEIEETGTIETGEGAAGEGG